MARNKRSVAEIEQAVREQEHTDNGVAPMLSYAPYWHALTMAEHLIDEFGTKFLLDTIKGMRQDAHKMGIEYYTALVCALNHKVWALHDKDEALARLYNREWEKADAWALEGAEAEDGSYNYKHFTTDDMRYYVRALD